MFPILIGAKLSLQALCKSFKVGWSLPAKFRRRPRRSSTPWIPGCLDTYLTLLIRAATITAHTQLVDAQTPRVGRAEPGPGLWILLSFVSGGWVTPQPHLVAPCYVYFTSTIRSKSYVTVLWDQFSTFSSCTLILALCAGDLLEKKMLLYWYMGLDMSSHRRRNMYWIDLAYKVD